MSPKIQANTSALMIINEMRTIACMEKRFIIRNCYF